MLESNSGSFPSNLFLRWSSLSVLCMCAKLLQSCPTLCNPVDYSPPGFSIYGILQERILAIPHSRGIFPTQGLNPCLLCFLHCRWICFLNLGASGKPILQIRGGLLCWGPKLWHHPIFFTSHNHFIIKFGLFCLQNMSWIWPCSPISSASFWLDAFTSIILLKSHNYLTNVFSILI